MSKAYICEAFSKLDMLNEDTIELHDEDAIEEIKDIIDDAKEQDEPEEVEVIDIEADEEEDLEDSYINKAILECLVCNSKIYKDLEEVEVNEEGNANEAEECPYCMSVGGYKILGKVAPFEAEPEVNVEVTELEEGCGRRQRQHKKSLKTEAWNSREKVTRYQVLSDVDGNISKFDTREEAEKNIKSFKRDDNKDPERKGKVKYEIKEITESLNESTRTGSDIYDDVWDFVSGTLSEAIFDAIDNLAMVVASEIPDYDADWCEKNSLHEYDTVNDSAYELTATFMEELFKNAPFALDESLNESLNNIELDTDTEHVSISATEKEAEPGEEMIAPLETEDEIDLGIEEEQEIEETEEEIPEEDEIDLEDFDEESFDELGESFMRKNYSNVDSFRTSKVSSNGSEIFVEGVIKFNSGNEKSTRFVFEAVEMKNGSLKLSGMNENFSRGHKSFSLSGKIENKKFISEAMRYNYRHKNEMNESFRVYGTVNR